MGFLGSRRAGTSSGGLDREFEEVALPHMDAVYHFAFSLARQVSTAEDLVQDTFLQAYRRFDTFELGTNCKAWLFRICKNLFIDRYRARKRRPAHQEIQTREPAVLDKDPATAALEQRGIDNEEIFLDLFGDEVNRFLAELPEEFRKALVLCDLEGLTYQEIADIEEVPIGTVRSRISRARSFLREKLEDYAQELGYASEAAGDHKADES